MGDNVKVRCSYRTDPEDGADTLRRGLLVFLHLFQPDKALSGSRKPWPFLFPDLRRGNWTLLGTA
jgi:hypothetical protein